MRGIRILGVDPGSRVTGYGIIEQRGNLLRHIIHGSIRLKSAAPTSQEEFAQRLHQLFQQLSAVILEYRPEVLAVERVFLASNAASALKLGHARGVVLLCGAQRSLGIAEYTARQVKQAVTGYGQADKSQVAKMVQVILRSAGTPGLQFSLEDESDALALAICHAQMSRFVRLTLDSRTEKVSR